MTCGKRLAIIFSRIGLDILRPPFTQYAARHLAGLLERHPANDLLDGWNHHWVYTGLIHPQTEKNDRVNRIGRHLAAEADRTAAAMTGTDDRSHHPQHGQVQGLVDVGNAWDSSGRPPGYTG